MHGTGQSVVRGIAAGMFVLGCLAMTLPAEAYCRATTKTAPKASEPDESDQSNDDPSTSGKCDYPSDKLPVFWSTPCVEYRVVVEPELKSKGFTDLQAREIVQTATKAWILASCESKLSKQPSPSIKLLDVDEQRCAGGPLGIAAETSNEIRFMDGDSPDLGVLAKTKRRFRASGALASSTIQVFRQRGEGNQVAEERMTPEQLKDYRTNVVRHELGHFLGLAHSNVADSIMYFQYNSQASVPLTADDRAAICEVYPPDAPPGQGCSVSAVESSNYAREASAIPPLVFVSWALVTVGARGRRRGAQPGRRSRRGLPKCP